MTRRTVAGVQKEFDEFKQKVVDEVLKAKLKHDLCDDVYDFLTDTLGLEMNEGEVTFTLKLKFTTSEWSEYEEMQEELNSTLNSTNPSPGTVFGVLRDIVTSRLSLWNSTAEDERLLDKKKVEFSIERVEAK